MKFSNLYLLFFIIFVVVACKSNKGSSETSVHEGAVATDKVTTVATDKVTTVATDKVATTALPGGGSRGGSPPFRRGTIEGVWGTSKDNVWAVARSKRSGIAIRWDGKSWAYVENKEKNRPPYTGVWGSKPDDVWIVGAGWGRKGESIAHWNGTELAFASTDIEIGFEDIWGSSAKDIWAVGHGGAIAHFDGKSWSAFKSPVKGDLAAVWGSGKKNFLAVGCKGNLNTDECDAGVVLRFDGRKWSVFREGPEYRYDAVWGSSAKDVWVIGSNWIENQGVFPKILRWNGKSWTYLEVEPLGETTYLSSVWGTGPNDVWIAGYYTTADRKEHTVVFHYDGSALNRVDGADLAYPGTIWGTGPDHVLIGGMEKVVRWNGSAWGASMYIGFEWSQDTWMPVLSQGVFSTP